MVYVVSKYGTPEHVFSNEVDALRHIFDEDGFTDEEFENLSINYPYILDTGYTICEWYMGATCSVMKSYQDQKEKSG